MAVRCTSLHRHYWVSRNGTTQEVPVRWSRVVTENLIFSIGKNGRNGCGAGKNVSMPVSRLWRRRKKWSYLLMEAEPVLVVDPFKYPNPDSDTGPAAPLPLVPKVPDPEALLAPLAPPALPPKAPMPLTGVQKGLSLMDTVTVVTY